MIVILVAITLLYVMRISREIFATLTSFIEELIAPVVAGGNQ
jgi:hypothetical protein